MSAVMREAFAEMTRRGEVLRRRLADLDVALQHAETALAELDAAHAAMREAGTAAREQIEHVQALRAIKAVG